MPIFKAGLGNAWLLYVPFFVGGVYLSAQDKAIAKRMKDMTGYDAKERTVTVIASLLAYPYMILSIWTPLTTIKSFFYSGAVLYLSGIVIFFFTLYAIINTPSDMPFSTGPYKLSRHPLYVSSAMIFISVSLITANVVMLIFAIVIIVPQHFMVLAEERVCRLKYGQVFEEYIKKVPRYVGLRIAL